MVELKIFKAETLIIGRMDDGFPKELTILVGEKTMSQIYFQTHVFVEQNC